MSKKVAEENGGMNLGEIGMIRNILMGEQLSQFEKRFLELQEEMTSMKEMLLKEIELGKNKQEQAINKLEEKNKAEISKMEINMKNSSDKIEKQINAALVNNQKDLGEALVKLGKKLIGS